MASTSSRSARRGWQTRSSCRALQKAREHHEAARSPARRQRPARPGRPLRGGLRASRAGRSSGGRRSPARRGRRAIRRTRRRRSTRPRRTTSASGPCTRRRRRKAGRRSAWSLSGTPPLMRDNPGSPSAASTRRTSREVIAAGATSIAVVRAIGDAPDPNSPREHSGRRWTAARLAAPLGGRSPVAQLAEHPAVNRRVVGSSPTRGVSQPAPDWQGGR